MIIISKELMRAIDACPTGPDFFTTMNLWGLEEKVVLQYMAQANMTDERDWWLKTKSTVAGMEAIAALCDPNYFTLGGFRVTCSTKGGVHFCQSHDQAVDVAQKMLGELTDSRQDLFVVNHACSASNGDVTWECVDLSTTQPPSGLQVFNPMTGMYLNDLTIDEAMSELASIKQQWRDRNHVLVHIEQQMISIDGGKAWKRIFW